MKYGTIFCECGQDFYFETVKKSVNCIRCGKRYDTNGYPEKEEFNEEATDQK